MAKFPIETGRVERYRGDQLVVDLPHLGLVERELSAVGARLTRRPEEDDRLGLALLTLRNTKDPVERLRAEPETQEALLELELASLRNRGTPPADVDLLLRGLRDRFSRRFGGWTPEMGKARVVEQVKGFPHLGGGGDGDPRPAAAGLFQAALEAAPDAGQGVRIGVLDTAIQQPAPPPVAAAIQVGRLKVAPDALLPAPPQGSAGAAPALKVTMGHGTFVVGLILQRAPGAAVLVRKVLDDDAVGDGWDAARKMVRLAGEHVDILNLSFGSFTDDDQPPLIFSRAVERLSPEVVIVAAAGNHGNIGQIQKIPGLEQLAPNTPIWPAALDGVVAVDAVSGNGRLARFSPKVPWVRLKARGVDVTSTFLDGQVGSERVGANGRVQPVVLGRFQGFATWSGTSFAAAIVSGALAARTQPGRLDAREALRELLKRQGNGNDRITAFTLKDLGASEPGPR
jgi:membrane-anchored mycosin MYCP